MRTISTVDGLNSLSAGSVIMGFDEDGTQLVSMKSVDGYWQEAGTDNGWQAEGIIQWYGGVTVLHEGAARYRPHKPHRLRLWTAHVIPAEAVEAAHRAWREQAALDGSIFEYNLRAALEAAAPYMLRAVWQSAYDQGVDDERTSQANPGIAGCFCYKSPCVCFIDPARENPYAK